MFSSLTVKKPIGMTSDFHVNFVTCKKVKHRVNDVMSSRYGSVLKRCVVFSTDLKLEPIFEPLKFFLEIDEILEGCGGMEYLMEFVINNVAYEYTLSFDEIGKGVKERLVKITETDMVVPMSAEVRKWLCGHIVIGDKRGKKPKEALLLILDYPKTPLLYLHTEGQVLFTSNNLSLADKTYLYADEIWLDGSSENTECGLISIIEYKDWQDFEHELHKAISDGRFVDLGERVVMNKVE
jgi:hypothetical protein